MDFEFLKNVFSHLKSPYALQMYKHEMNKRISQKSLAPTYDKKVN